LQKFFSLTKRLIGFTGSNLRELHIKLVERILEGTVIRMNPRLAQLFSLICHHQEVTTKVKDYRDRIE
jgi:hypothetical protein